MIVIQFVLEIIAVIIIIYAFVWISDHFKGILWTVVGITLLASIYWLVQDHIDGIIEFLMKLPGYAFALFKYAFIVSIICGIVTTLEAYVKEKKNKRLQSNEDKLYQALRNTFSEKDIGYIRREDALDMFSHYANKDYPPNKNFQDMLFGFIDDFEQQNFRENTTWAEPYVQYIVKMRGRSLRQLLQEVDGPLKHFAHTTPDEKLLSDALNGYIQKKGTDTPAILKNTLLNDGIILYQPTEYGIRLYNKTLGHSESEEIDFDNL